MVEEAAVARYLGHVMPGTESVEVHDLRRITGGASRETWSFDAVWRENGADKRRGLIVRLDPGASLLESNREIEYQIYRSVAGSDIPVPEALWLENSDEWLGGPFFVMERIDGCETSPQRMFAEPYASSLDALGERLFEIGGAISAFDWREAGLDIGEPPELDTCWERELSHWERIIEKHRTDTQPIVRAAIDWLRRHPPPPAQRISLVHGDYRNGNVLYNERGEIRGVLDWEMAHLGDPIEDIAWACREPWRWGRPELMAGLLPQEQAFAIWERSSGVSIDAEAYRWWEIFSQVKSQGIWLTGARNFADGKTDDTFMPMITVSFLAREDALLLRLLGWDGEGA